MGVPGISITWFSGRGAPSGIQFSGPGSARINKNVGTLMPTSHSNAKIGAAPLSVCESIKDLMMGDKTIPPTDNPELAAAIADARFE
jgi:hypothetical protein